MFEYLKFIIYGILGFFKILVSFIKSLDPDHRSFQQFFKEKEQKEMEIHNIAFTENRESLMELLPIEIVERILAYAEMNPYTLLHREAEIRGQQCDIPYLTFYIDPMDVNVPLHQDRIEKIENCRVITGIKLKALAHDQGWSEFRADINTTNNSWTFGELVLETGVDERRVRVYTNLHANSEYQAHKAELDFDDEFVMKINEQLRQNKRVRLSFNVKALYPGWIHYIKEASIQLFYFKRDI